MPNRQTVRELDKLYTDLAGLDKMLVSMLSNVEREGDAIHKVSFYHRTDCFSGPADYEPTHRAKQIAEHVIADMRVARSLLVTRIHDLGFETPVAPEAAQEPR